MGKQAQLPTLEDKHDEDLTRLADDYVDKRDRRMTLTKEEGAAKDLLLLKMQEKKLETYHDPDTGISVTIEPGEATVKVKKPTTEKSDPADAAA